MIRILGLQRDNTVAAKIVVHGLVKKGLIYRLNIILEKRMYSSQSRGGNHQNEGYDIQTTFDNLK
jgi:hypothetical protein